MIKNQDKNRPAQRIADNTYDRLGQLKKKNVGGTTLQAALQNVDYAYNIRGWLKTINDVNNIGTIDLFAFKLGYNEGTTPLYNGNISQTQWKTRNTDSSLKTYNYTYDALNRIKTAVNTNANYNLDLVDYDKNGNITALKRKGHTNAAATTFGMMDDLVYNYDAGNKLTKVEDLASLEGFKNGANTAIEYTYDTNGNMVSDANKGITNIAYNHLNLPTTVTFSGTNKKIDYFYDAVGTKLKKVVTDASSLITTEYAGNYVYENSVLQFFNTAEGYVEPKGTGWEYVYQYKDHLGNIRLSYADLDNNGAINASTEILSEKNYYPFGLLQKGYNNVISSNANSTAEKYKYQGQELEEDLGLNMYEFELRQYDASIGRFVSTDPFEQFDSPYVAMGNNPIVSFDPDGGYCLDANGNQVACPDDAGDFYDEYKDSETNHITILDEVEVSNDDSDDNTNSSNISFLGYSSGSQVLDPTENFYYRFIEGRTIEKDGLVYDVDANGKIIGLKPLGGLGAIGLIGGVGKSPEDLLEVAKIIERGGLTKIGRSLQKHGSRIGSKFPRAIGSPASINAQGEKILKEILTNPASTSTARHHARFGEIIEIVAPNGQGARFSKDGKTFFGLINK